MDSYLCIFASEFMEKDIIKIIGKTIQLRKTQSFSFLTICTLFSEAEKVPEVVSRVPGSSKVSELEEKAGCSFDVLVCGGTLGIFIATALVTRGLHVAIIERNLIKGVLP